MHTLSAEVSFPVLFFHSENIPVARPLFKTVMSIPKKVILCYIFLKMKMKQNMWCFYFLQVYFNS